MMISTLHQDTKALTEPFCVCMMTVVRVCGKATWHGTALFCYLTNIKCVDVKRERGILS